MIKSRYIVAFSVLLTVVIVASVFTYNKNYHVALRENTEAVENLTDSIQHQYDTVFLQICSNVEYTIEMLNHEDMVDHIIEQQASSSIYIEDFIIIKDTGEVIGAGQDEIDLSMARPFFIDEENTMCAGMIESETVDNKFYAVNKITKPNGESYLLLVGLNYKYINAVISPGSITAFDSYPYLLSNDGYFLYHPDKDIYGKNIFIHKELVKKEAGLSESDYQTLINTIAKDQRFNYNAYHIEKVAFSRNLQTFRGTIILAANYTEMKNIQYIATVRTVVPLIICSFIGAYVFIRYIYLMKYTDYFTEVKNNRAFRKHYAKESSGKDKLVILKINNVISSDGQYTFNDDQVFYKISSYFRSFSSLYKDMYRISRIHYAFVLEGKRSEMLKIIKKLKENLLHRSDESLFLRGEVLMLSLDAKGPIQDIDSFVLNQVEDYYEPLNMSRERLIYDYSMMLNEYNENIHKKNIVESMILNNDIEPYFQSIVDLKNKETFKYEVLMRPKNIVQLLPEEIIQIAEENGWVESIDKSIIKQAMYFYNKVLVEKRKRLKLSINLSGKSINNSTVEYLMNMVKKCDVKTKDITIEITETAAFENLEESIRKLRYLSSQGFKLAIDDFGTGYAHVELLSKLEVDYVKIDGVFVNNAEKDERKIKTLNALVYLAKNYNTKVIAEYVESSAIIKILEKLEVEYGQGFYFDKPMNIATFINKEL
ncbi:EAL domain-containing protein [Acidaminobacter sp. JC074]|uniref:EAL domain-containing protein n=1 Tax=Acidaminobacter sp. JC074 TaxID=2530199 RepID=UPI001F0FC1D8|nr:EAL domain-containing protein [Acidaminobacter sp. JC074]MCH4890805.1 EAL domain-containing protein [Acidaminobacter sp. JC074]